MEQNNESQVEQTISLLDLWKVFKRAFWLMLIAAILVTGISMLYNKLTYEEEYTSTASLLLLPQQNDAEKTDVENWGYSQSYANLILNPCMQLLQALPVFEKTATKLSASSTEYNFTSEELQSMFSIENNDTTIITLKFTADDPQVAKTIMDAYISEATVFVTTKFAGSSIDTSKAILTPLMDSTLPTVPSNSPFSIMSLLYGIVAALVVYIIFFIVFLSNDVISTAEMLENTINAPVLGTIPNLYDTGKRASKYYGKVYGKYGQYGRSPANETAKGE